MAASATAPPPPAVLLPAVAPPVGADHPFAALPQQQHGLHHHVLHTPLAWHNPVHDVFDPFALVDSGGTRVQHQHRAEVDAARAFGAPLSADDAAAVRAADVGRPVHVSVGGGVRACTSRADTPSSRSTQLLAHALASSVLLDVVCAYATAADLGRLCTASKQWQQLITRRGAQLFSGGSDGRAALAAVNAAAAGPAGVSFGFAATELSDPSAAANAEAVSGLQAQFDFAVDHPFAVQGVQYATERGAFQDSVASAYALAERGGAIAPAITPPPLRGATAAALVVSDFHSALIDLNAATHGAGGVATWAGGDKPAAAPAPASSSSSSSSSSPSGVAAAASGSSNGAAAGAGAGAAAASSSSASSSSASGASGPQRATGVRTRRAPSAAEEISVAILDAGAQYGKVIDRRVRELCVHSEILPLNTSAELLRRYGAIIVSGGPQSVYAPDAPKCDPQLLHIGKPVLGICYGLQLINYMSGGGVAKHAVREDGQFRVDVDTTSALFKDLPKQISVLLTHGDSVSQVAKEYKQIGTSTSSGLVAAIQHKTLPIAAVQFHPEVDLTEHGLAMIRNFLFGMAKLPALYTPASRQEQAIAHIRDVVGDTSHVLMLISGGVDSTVCAALLKAAIGADRIRAIHINNGFMRQRESEGVAKALAAVGLPIKVVDAAQQFYSATTTIGGKRTARLDECCVPEWKRKIIGDTFVHVAQQAMADFGLDPNAMYLAQGTLRPDLIESASDMASSNAEVIKTHHNDTELVRALRKARRVLEPLKDYHKDEVRALGIELGLPKELVWRQPFPGPGLAVRILCGNTPQLPEPAPGAVRAIVQKSLEPYNTERIDARVLPVRTVGVQGDSRSYSSLVALSCKQPYTKPSAAVNVVATPPGAAPVAAVATAVATAPVAGAGARTDAKDSKAAPAAAAAPSVSPLAGIPWGELFETALSIPKRVHGVNRVVFVFGAPLDSSVEETAQGYTPTYLQPEPIAQLQAADAVVNAVLLKYQLTKVLSQVPVILFPANFGEGKGKRSVTIRTFITNDFMTGLPAVPGSAAMPYEALQEMVDGVMSAVPGIARVCYDLTAKPPATTEWE